MTQYAFFFNQKRCLGCKTCVIACKEWNESKRGDANLNRALTEETAGTFDTPASWAAGAGRTLPLFRYRSAAIIVLNRRVFRFVLLRPFLRKLNTAQSEWILPSASAAEPAELPVRGTHLSTTKICRLRGPDLP